MRTQSGIQIPEHCLQIWKVGITIEKERKRKKACGLPRAHVAVITIVSLKEWNLHLDYCRIYRRVITWGVVQIEVKHASKAEFHRDVVQNEQSSAFSPPPPPRTIVPMFHQFLGVAERSYQNRHTL